MATNTNAYTDYDHYFFLGGGGGVGGHFVIHSHLTSLLLTCTRKSENDTKPKSNSLKFQCFI